MTRPAHPRRELDCRTLDGLEISLLWDPETQRVYVSVRDLKRGDVFEIRVPPGERALDVFARPYAYPATEIHSLSELVLEPLASAAHR